MDDLPFRIGERLRRSDIHGKLGGQRQGGISTPSGPFLLLFSSSSGKEYGYRDEWIDETFFYTGEGQSGDMTFTRGNRALAWHQRSGKRLLLFTKDSGSLYNFEGELVCEGFDRVRRPDRAGMMRDAIEFRLRHVENSDSYPEYMGYVTSRGFDLPTTKEGLEAGVWFSMWSNKQWPYDELVQGDLLYWYESRTGGIVWKSRVIKVVRFTFEDKGEAETKLRSELGAFDQTQSYFLNAADKGYCLGYKVKAVERLRYSKPRNIKFPQLGWLRIDNGIASSWLKEPFIPTLTTLEDLEPPSKDITDWMKRVNEKMSGLSPKRVQTLVNQWLRRDAPMVKRLKDAYDFTCQFPGCGTRIRKRNGEWYVEVAHIAPIHEGGKSVLGNLLVLCPNHHKEFDYGERIIKEQTTSVLRGKLNGRDFEITFLPLTPNEKNG